MKQIVGFIRSYCEALLRKIDVQVAERLRYETIRLIERPLQSERRQEARSSKISPCIYGLMRAVDCDGSILEEGHGVVINRNPTGIRLLLGVAPSKGQLLEVQTGDSTIGAAICLVEVCWTKPLRRDVQGVLHLVGCRQHFGLSWPSVESTHVVSAHQHKQYRGS